MMQIFAPAGASLSMARALQADPLGRAVICGETGNPGDAGKAPHAPFAPDGCCPLCHFVHLGAAPPPPPAAQIARPAPLARPATWKEGAERLASGEHYYHAPARAPPFAI
nr:DUF2946 family protein [Candidatus Rhodoblastus alkanivorans]